MANFRDFVHQDYLKESGVLEEGPFGAAVGATVGHKLALAGSKIMSKVPGIGSHFQGKNDTRELMDAVMSGWARYRAQQGLEADMPSLSKFISTNGFESQDGRRSLSNPMNPADLQRRAAQGADQPPISKAPDQATIDQLIHALENPESDGGNEHEAAAQHLIQLSQKQQNQARIGQWMTYLTFHNPELVNNPVMAPLAALRRGKIFSKPELYALFQGLARNFLDRYGPADASTDGSGANGVQNANGSNGATFDKNDPLVDFLSKHAHVSPDTTIGILNHAKQAQNVEKFAQAFQQFRSPGSRADFLVGMTNGAFMMRGGKDKNTNMGNTLQTLLRTCRFTGILNAQDMYKCWLNSSSTIFAFKRYMADKVREMQTNHTFKGQDDPDLIHDLSLAAAVALMAYVKSPAAEPAAQPTPQPAAATEQQPA